MLLKEEHYISSQWRRLCEDGNHHDLFLGLCLCHIGVLVGILLSDNLFPFRSVGKIGIKQQISPECRSSIKQCKSLRCVGVQEKEASVAADEMAVKRQSADTNFLEKKIGL